MPEKVLIIDDLSMVRASLRCLILELAPLHVEEVDCLAGAKEWLKQSENTAGLVAIFCDWKCTDGSVLDLLEHLKAENLKVHVYCLAPHAGSHIVHQAVRQGAQGSLQKPLRRKQMNHFRKILKTAA